MAKNKRLRKPDSGVATQSNLLVEASYRMSVRAKRVMLMLLGGIHPGQKEVTGKITIYASDYAEKTGVSEDQAYRDIKSGCQELMQTIIQTRDYSKKTTEMCVVVGWMRYHEDQGWLEACFTLWVAPYIHHLAKIGYTSIRVDEALKFRRFYTIRFYELLMQFKKTGDRYITVESLREILRIDESKYSRFTDFRKYVIEPSIREIEEKTDWAIDWEPVRTGRKITSITLIFEESKQLKLDL